MPNSWFIRVFREGRNLRRMRKGEKDVVDTKAPDETEPFRGDVGGSG
jgi:hypothetical protein